MKLTKLLNAVITIIQKQDNLKYLNFVFSAASNMKIQDNAAKYDKSAKGSGLEWSLKGRVNWFTIKGEQSFFETVLMMERSQ